MNRMWYFLRMREAPWQSDIPDILPGKEFWLRKRHPKAENAVRMIPRGPVRIGEMLTSHADTTGNPEELTSFHTSQITEIDRLPAGGFLLRTISGSEYELTFANPEATELPDIPEATSAIHARMLDIFADDRANPALNDDDRTRLHQHFLDTLGED